MVRSHLLKQTLVINYTHIEFPANFPVRYLLKLGLGIQATAMTTKSNSETVFILIKICNDNNS